MSEKSKVFGAIGKGIAAIGLAPTYAMMKTVAVVTGDEKMSRETDEEYREIRERAGEFGAEHGKDAATAIVTVAGTVASALAVDDHLRGGKQPPRR